MAPAQTVTDGTTAWVATWGTGTSSSRPTTSCFTRLILLPGHRYAFNDQTVRLIVHTPAWAASQVRIRLSNELGTAPLTVERGAHVALSDGPGPSIVAGSDRTLVTFRGGSAGVRDDPCQRSPDRSAIPCRC